jgi:hypothetical protein
MKQEDVKINQIVKCHNALYKVVGMKYDPEAPNEPLFMLIPVKETKIWRTSDQFSLAYTS